MNKLEKARIDINQIDAQLAKLFEARMQAVEDVVAYKQANNLAVLDAEREAQLIENNSKLIDNDKYLKAYQEWLTATMKISREYQQHLLSKGIIAYQGVEGAFAHVASSKLFPNETKHSYPSWEEVFKAVVSGEAQYGVIPFENSYTGEVGEVSDLLREYPVYIIQVYDLKIDQNLLGIPGTKISDIKEVYSHPQGLKQSAKFFKGRDVELKPYANTALAAKYVHDCNDYRKAAIASEQTASLYDLEILERDIQTSNDNTTRFIVISTELNKSGNRFQLIFDVKNETGTLANAIDIIANAGFNMVSIKSRAIPKRSWEYYFNVEIEGSLNDPKAQAMLTTLNQQCSMLKVVGSYER